MQNLKIEPNGVLVIPKALRGMFQPSDKIACFVEGDTLILKKMNLSRLSSLAGRIKEKPMPMREIVKEIRAYRKEKRTR